MGPLSKFKILSKELRALVKAKDTAALREIALDEDALRYDRFIAVLYLTEVDSRAALVYDYEKDVARATRLKCSMPEYAAYQETVDRWLTTNT